MISVEVNTKGPSPGKKVPSSLEIGGTVNLTKAPAIPERSGWAR